MSNDTKIKEIQSITLWHYTLGLICAWSFFIASLLFWNNMTEQDSTYEAAKIQARATFEKDVVYRLWNAENGGVYGLVTKKTQPNPYLDIPERDIQTPSGKKLTKINPAFMTRQVHELGMKTFGILGHITSLNPIRPENAPDEWEAKALKAFEKGKQEVSSVEKIRGKKYMRLMSPLTTVKNCLKCHAKQGYKVGDIRGGISVSIPLSPLITIERHNVLTFSIIGGLIWLAGIIGIGLGMLLLNRQINQRLKIEGELRQNEKLQGIIEMSGAVCHELNQPLQIISGNTELLLMSIEDDNPAYHKIVKIKQQADLMGEITKKLMGITKYKTKDYPDGKILDIDKTTSS